MERLLKSQNWIVAFVVAVCLGLMVLVLPRLPDRGCSMPVWALIVGEYLWVIAVLICVQFKELSQSFSNLRIVPGFVSLGLIFFATAIGIIVSPVAKLGNDGTISLGLGQLTVMNLSVLFLICAIINRGHTPETNHTVEEDPNSATSTSIKRLTQIRVKAIGKTHENLMSLQLPPELEALRDATLQSIEPSVNYEAKDQSGNRNPGVLNKTQQNLTQSSNSTLKKNTGSISAEQLMQKLQRPGSRQAGDSSTLERPVVTAKGDVQSQEADLPPELKRLAKVQNKIIDPNKPSNHTTEKLQGLSASGTGAANLLPSANSASASEQTGLRSVLDRLDSPDQALPNVLEEAAQSQAMINEQVAQASQGQTIFKQPIDKDMDQLFAQIAPADSQREIDKTVDNAATVFSKSVDKDMDDLFDKIAPIEAQREVVSAKGEVQEPIENAPIIGSATVEKPIIDQAAKIFKNTVDGQIEDIFAGLTPKEAQREVDSAKWVAEPIIENPIIQEVVIEKPVIDQASKVFQNTVDGQIEDIFAGLAPKEAQKEVGSVKREAPEPIIEEPAIQKLGVETPVIDQAPKVFQNTVDGQIEDIFAGLAPKEAQREVGNIKREIQEPVIEKSAMAANSGEIQSNSESSADEITGERAAVIKNFADTQAAEKGNLVPELKDFGRLSAKASAEHESSAQVGTMKTIGKLLIDSQSVENLIKKADSGKITVNLPSAHVISVLRGEGIQNLLENIDTCEGVEGSMLVGADGLVISSTFASAGDREGTGVLAHGILGNTNIGVMRLDLGKLEQMIMVSKTGEKNDQKAITTICTDVGVGMLAVFLDKTFMVGLDDLLDKITLIAQG